MIKADELFFSYTGAPPYVLCDINFDMRDGEYVSILGENGSGKTTLMRLLLKFLKPTSGTISVQAERIGYVPQKRDSGNTDFPITVYEALNSYRKLLRLKNKDVITEKLEQVGMTGFSGALVGTLSGGQSQKILIARALMGNPDLIILDEPSSGVDHGSQKEIYGILKRINMDKGITILSVEHNLEAAVSNSTMLYHLIDGRGHFCAPHRYAEEFMYQNERGDENASL